jgi:hypothetical protein
VIDCDFDKIFTSHEIEDMMGQSVNARVGVWNILTTMWISLHLFKSLTNFTLVEFDNWQL